MEAEIVSYNQNLDKKLFGLKESVKSTFILKNI